MFVPVLFHFGESIPVPISKPCTRCVFSNRLRNEASLNPPANRSSIDSQQPRCLGDRESLIYQLMHHAGLYVKEKANPDGHDANPATGEYLSFEENRKVRRDTAGFVARSSAPGDISSYACAAEIRSLIITRAPYLNPLLKSATHPRVRSQNLTEHSPNQTKLTSSNNGCKILHIWSSVSRSPWRRSTNPEQALPGKSQPIFPIKTFRSVWVFPR